MARRPNREAVETGHNHPEYRSPAFGAKDILKFTISERPGWHETYSTAEDRSLDRLLDLEPQPTAFRQQVNPVALNGNNAERTAIRCSTIDIQPVPIKCGRVDRRMTMHDERTKICIAFQKPASDPDQIVLGLIAQIDARANSGVHKQRQRMQIPQRQPSEKFAVRCGHGLAGAVKNLGPSQRRIDAIRGQSRSSAKTGVIKPMRCRTQPRIDPVGLRQKLRQETIMVAAKNDPRPARGLTLHQILYDTSGIRAAIDQITDMDDGCVFAPILSHTLMCCFQQLQLAVNIANCIDPHAASPFHRPKPGAPGMADAPNWLTAGIAACASG